MPNIVKWKNMLSTTEPFNNIGLVKVRQDNTSETWEIRITENGRPYDFSKRKITEVYFNTKFSRDRVVEQRGEIIDAKKGIIQYTMNNHDMQEAKPFQAAYFEFRSADGSYVDSTQTFFYHIIQSKYKECTDGSTYIVRLEELFKLYMDYHTKQTEDWERFVESNREILESIDPGGKILAELIDGRYSKMLDKHFPILQARGDFWDDELASRGVRPSWFGAIGDGKTDDTKALDTMMQYAKENNYPIFFEDKEYIWNPEKTIDFYNSIDFGKSKIIRQSAINEGNPLIVLRHSKNRIPFDVTSLSTKINRITTQITELKGNGNCLIHVYDNTSKLFHREGVDGDSNGVTKFDQFLIDNDGYVKNKITYDFDSISSIIIQPIDNNVVTVSGGNFYAALDGKLKDYTNDALLINRSNVVLKNINSNDDSSLSKATNGVINIIECANIGIHNTLLSPKVFSDKGTYDFSATKVINLFLKNVRGQNNTNNVWGVMGTNFIKNMTVDECSLNRVDAHMSVTNLTVKNSEIGRGGITCVGYGDLILENIRTTAQNVINLRKDYGAFWSGNISAKNITQIRVKDEALSFIFAEYYMDHDYSPGVNNVGLGTGIFSIDNYVIDDNNLVLSGTNNVTPIIRLRSLVKKTETILHDYRLPKTIKVNSAKIVRKNDEKTGFAFMTDVNTWSLRAQSNAKIYPSENFETNVNVELNDIDFADFAGIDWRSSLFIYGATNSLGTNADDNYADVLSRPFWNITVRDSNLIHASTLGRFVKLQIDNTTIQAALCYQRGSRSYITSSDCTIRPRANSEDSILFKARYDRWFFNNCYFDQAFVKDTTTVIANPFKSVIQDLFIFATGKGQPIIPTSSMSSCYLTAQYDLSKLKPDIKNFNFKFGNWVPYQVFHPLIGDNNDVPKNNLYPGLQFFNTTYNKLQLYDGSAWRDSSGNPV